MSKEAMRLALEALEWCHGGEPCGTAEAITALREALAEQKSGIKQVIELYDSPDQPSQQEPVAWLVDNGGDSILIRHSQNFPGVFVGSEFNKRPLVFGDTSPPAQRKPLTDEQIEDIWADCPADWDDKINVLTLARAIEAAHGIKGEA